MSPTPFGARLAESMAARGPLCVGIDPHPSLLADWGLEVSAAGLEKFSMTVVEALADRIAVLKPQFAFFEPFGAAGIAVLEKVLAAGREAGALMLADAKRGDIGSTMAAYARAYLHDDSPLAADAVTVSPFLGFGSLQPAIDAALDTGRGLFVLCRTSNPEGGSVQLASSRGGMTISAQIAAAAGELNAGAEPMGSIGLVVGATITEVSADLQAAHAPLLAPGIGAQGATAADLRRVFGDARSRVLPSASRSVLRGGPTVASLRDAAARTVDELRTALQP